MKRYVNRLITPFRIGGGSGGTTGGVYPDLTIKYFVDGAGGTTVPPEMTFSLSGSDLTITSATGGGFGAKPNSPKPLLYFKADDGIAAPSSLGRTTTWDGTFYGAVNATEKYGNSTQAVRYEFKVGNSDAPLSAVDFSGTRLYVHRTKYDDFDITTDWAVRTFTTLNSGSFSVGQVVTGGTSGATATISYITSGNTLWYTGDPTAGGFVTGETLTSATGNATNDELSGGGTFRSFNYKTIRMLTASGGTANNQHINAQGANSATYSETVENPTATFSAWDVSASQTPNTWENEELVYESGDLNVQDGIFNYLRNGQQHYTEKFIQRNATYSDRFGRLFQSQVSNGAQDGSYTYYDSLYVDDSWCRVVLSDSATLPIGTVDPSTATFVDILVPTAWADGEIEVHVPDTTKLAGNYVHVIDSTGALVASEAYA